MRRRHLLDGKRTLQHINLNLDAEARAYMTDIKPVIDNLTKLLAQCEFIKVPAEILRQAKFDKENACSYFWHLLAELLQSKQSHWTYPSRKTDFSEHPPAVDRNITVFVKYNLIAENYPYSFAFDLPAECGSRNLLLAFGWFVAEKNAVDHLVKLRLEKLAIKLENDLLQTKTTSRHVSSVIEIITNSSDSNLDVREMCQRLVWFIGKTKLTGKNLLNVQQEGTKLISKIFALPAIELFGHNSLSLNLQINLLKHPKLQMKFLKRLSEETNFLKMFLKWKEKEHIFWRWMSSVADLHNSSQLQQPTNVHDDLDIILKFSRQQCEEFIKYYNDFHSKDTTHHSATKLIISQYSLILDQKNSKNSFGFKLNDELFRREAMLREKLKPNLQLAKELFPKLCCNLKGVVSIPPTSHGSIKY